MNGFPRVHFSRTQHSPIADVSAGISLYVSISSALPIFCFQMLLPIPTFASLVVPCTRASELHRSLQSNEKQKLPPWQIRGPLVDRMDRRSLRSQMRAFHVGNGLPSIHLVYDLSGLLFQGGRIPTAMDHTWSSRFTTCKWTTAARVASTCSSSDNCRMFRRREKFSLEELRCEKSGVEKARRMGSEGAHVDEVWEHVELTSTWDTNPTMRAPLSRWDPRGCGTATCKHNSPNMR